VDAAAVLADGFQAYADTRRRVGVGDGTRAAFTARFTQRGRCRGHLFLGAWHERQLAGFLSVTEVDDWAEIEGCFSSNATLGLRPNDTLMAAALTEFLVTRRRRRVSYGVSSIQAVSNAAGLHEFKTKVGFEAVPVHRAFVPHPWLRPCVNPAAQRCLAAMLRLNPHSRVLKKCEGVMAAMLGRRTLAEA
jgi:hypothetical protein